MGILQKLIIISINKNLRSNIDDESIVLDDVEDIKKRFILPFNNFYQRNNIKIVIKEDYFIMQELRKEHEDLFKKAKKFYKLVQEISDSHSYDVAKEYSTNLMRMIIIFEEFIIKEQHEILKDFNYLLEKYDLNDDDISSFIKKHSHFFKIKTNKKIKKEIEKILKYHIKECELNQPGPIITESEINHLRNRLNQYFESDLFLKLIQIYNLEKISINVSIYGSLVTGFASQYSKYKDLPSDYERTSDVDLGIVIDTNAIKNISLNGRCLFKEGVYYGPFYKNKSEKLGPFMKIFYFVNDIPVAKKIIER